MMSLMNHDIQLIRNAIVTTTMTALIGVTYASIASLIPTGEPEPVSRTPDHSRLRLDRIRDQPDRGIERAVSDVV
jgi:hypothetical protein